MGWIGFAFVFVLRVMGMIFSTHVFGGGWFECVFVFLLRVMGAFLVPAIFVQPRMLLIVASCVSRV